MQELEDMLNANAKINNSPQKSTDIWPKLSNALIKCPVILVPPILFGSSCCYAIWTLEETLSLPKLIFYGAAISFNTFRVLLLTAETKDIFDTWKSNTTSNSHTEQEEERRQNVNNIDNIITRR